VSRAVSGTSLSRKTLELFINAFAIAPDDEERLWRLWDGSGKIRVLTGSQAVPSELVTAVGQGGCRPVSVHEHHYVGEDGLPLRHRTLQVIEATVDNLDRYHYRFDTDALTVEVGQGCREISGPVYEIRKGIYSIDIVLASPLARGDTVTIGYTTTFDYLEPPKPELRKAAQGRIYSVNLRVEFHPDKLPTHVWWAVWNGIDGDTTSEEEVQLDAQYAAQRFLREMENTVVGFHWAW
jgi:hypothetical protein